VIKRKKEERVGKRKKERERERKRDECVGIGLCE